MKYKILFFFVIGSILLSLASSDFRPQSNTRNPNMQLSISSSKETYVRGEIVTINLHLTNNGSDRIRIGGAPHPENKYTQFFVSRNGMDFVKYSNPDWGRKPHVPGLRYLLPKQSSDGTAKILWNEKPNVRGMNTRAAENWQRGKILTDYTFPDAGTYFVKAAVWGMVDRNGQGLPRVESEPIEITIEEPEGEDLAIWRIIQNREDIAYFMQDAEIKNAPADRRRETSIRLVNELERIVDRYPDSIIAAQIRQKLQEYRLKYPRQRTSN